jgi:hypothetical protein
MLISCGDRLMPCWKRVADGPRSMWPVCALRRSLREEVLCELSWSQMATSGRPRIEACEKAGGRGWRCQRVVLELVRLAKSGASNPSR